MVRFKLHNVLFLSYFHHHSVLAEPDHDNVRIITARQQYMYSESGDRYLDMRNNVHHGKLHVKPIHKIIILNIRFFTHLYIYIYTCMCACTIMYMGRASTLTTLKPVNIYIYIFSDAHSIVVF